MTVAIVVGHDVRARGRRGGLYCWPGGEACTAVELAKRRRRLPVAGKREDMP
jgi:hypothetical protein